MFKSVSIVPVLLILLVVSFVGKARADDNVASTYLHTRNQLSSRPGSASDLSADQNSQVQISRYYELSGRIVGQVTTDSQPIVLLDCKVMTAEISAPTTFLTDTDWMDSGSVIRVLVKSVPGSPTDGSVPVLQLVAAGPEDSIRTLEQQLAADQAKIDQMGRERQQLRQLGYSTSRSGTLARNYVASSVPVSGLSARAASIYPAYYNAVARLNPRLSGNDVATITKSILYYSDQYQLDPRLVVAMVIAESGFDPNCVSRTGATGLGQLMPGTAAGLGVSDPYDPVQNIAGAVRLLSNHVQEYGGAAPYGVVPMNTLMLTMAAYNAGSGAVRKYGGVPPYKETQSYVRKVNELYRELCGG